MAPPTRCSPEAELADIYEDVELVLLHMMAQRLKRRPDVAGWQLDKLLELQRFRTEAAGRLRVSTAELKAGILQLLRERYHDGSALASAVVSPLGERRNRGLLLPRGDSYELLALLREQVSMVDASAFTILRSVEDAYRDIVRQAAAPALSTGTVTRTDAVQLGLNKLADRGLTGFTDRVGRKWEMRAYVEMATGTAAHRASTQGHLEQLTAEGYDQVRVSDHAGECPICRKWEGRVLSIAGATPGVPTVAAARAAGLEHPGCRHRYSVYLPGVSKAQKPQGKPEDYDHRVQQRAIERRIRAWKRRAAVGDPKAPAYVQKWKGALAEHVEAHGLTRRYDRERVMTGETGQFADLKPRPT